MFEPRRGVGVCTVGAGGEPVGVVGGELAGECVAAEAYAWLVTNAGYCDGFAGCCCGADMLVNGWTAKGSKEASGEVDGMANRGGGEGGESEEVW